MLSSHRLFGFASYLVRLAVRAGCILCAASISAPLCAQTTTAAPPQPPELSAHDTNPSFRLRARREMVLLGVVVRDAQGHTVPGLRREDFSLTDNGKREAIGYFSVEFPARPAAGEKDSAKGSAAPASETPVVSKLPERYVGLYFDDVHTSVSDLVSSRDAADKYLKTALGPDDRAGIFTSSGLTMQDFTNDLEKLHAALWKLRVSPVGATVADPCMGVDGYLAYQAIWLHDTVAEAVLQDKALHCQFQDDPRMQAAAMASGLAEAQTVLQGENFAVQYSIRGLEELVKRMSVLPGQRSVVMVSPGFFSVDEQQFVDEMIAQALTQGVVINTLDARELYTVDPAGDIANPSSVTVTEGPRTMYRVEGIEHNRDVLSDIAWGTGGRFFEGSNDLESGFRIVGTLPEMVYILGFSPGIVKTDGKFHTLKVKLLAKGHFDVQARRGYYAPTKSQDPKELEAREIEDAVYSNEEMHELGIDVHTQYYKSGALDAKLTVVTKVDANSLHFHKDADRNVEDFVLVTALFDPNGNYVIGQQKTVNLRLKDATLQALDKTGIAIQNTFDVKVGNYVVRAVLREEDAGHFATVNQSVEIP
ncbi:MAG: VWA domain-containing protein [Candidatus Acidiferrales bacterium]